MEPQPLVNDDPASGAPDWSDLAEMPTSELFPPEGIKPQVWERLQLRFPREPGRGHFISRLVGYIKDASILITMPVQNGRRADMAEGETLEVRMITGGDICFFESTVQRVCISPTHYLHLEYPERVRVQRLRKSPWARVDMAATVTGADGETNDARLVNLSPDGAQFHMAAIAGKHGDVLRISCPVKLDNLTATLGLEAVIRHMHPAGPAEEGANEEGTDETIEYGVSFRNVSPENALWLRGIVYQRIAEGWLA